MIAPANRERFLADPEASFTDAGLTEEEKDLVRRRDWRGLIHYGVIFFMLEKLGAVVGTSNLHIYAAMRGESLEDFMKTRNTKVIYSVAGNDAANSADLERQEVSPRRAARPGDGRRFSGTNQPHPGPVPACTSRDIQEPASECRPNKDGGDIHDSTKDPARPAGPRRHHHPCRPAHRGGR